MKKINNSLKSAVKIIAINILLLAGLLYIINLSIVLFYNAYKGLAGLTAADNRPYVESRHLLPNYEKIEWAAIHFRENSEIESEYRSFIGWRRLPYRGQTINIDGDGIRIIPQPDLAKEDAPTVVFLGGSTMWGTGSDDKNTIPALFAKFGQNQYKVVNLGETAYNAFQGFVFLKLKMHDGLKPDIIIAYDGVNETFKYSGEFKPNTHSREYLIRDIMRGVDTRSQLDDSISLRTFFLGPLESFINIIINRISLSEQASTYDTSSITGYSQQRTERIAKELLDSWLSTKYLAEQNNTIFIAILQPNVATGSPRLDHLKGEDFEDFTVRVNLLYPAIIELMNSPEYKELKDNFLDLTNVFDGEKYIYIDWCHVSPNGNMLIAEKIYNHIILNTYRE